MIAVATAYLSGLFFASFFTGAKSFVVPLGFFMIFLIIGISKKFSANDFAVVIVSFTVAFSTNSIYTRYVYENIVSYNGINGSFSGIITDYDVYDGDKANYIIKGKINNRRTAKISVFCDNIGADYGDGVNIENCTFSIIKGDYLFDSKSYYKSQRVFLNAEKCGNITLEKRDSHKIRNFLANYKAKIISDFRIKLGDECGGILSGMVFGEKGFIGDNLKNSLYRTGIGHVMAVSGLHISVMAFAMMSVLNFLKINKFLCFVLVNILMIAMTVMADCPVSAIRAVIMLDMSFSARLFLRQNDTFNSLAIAVLLICLENPYVIYSSGFWLSVSGTFGIGVFAPYMVKNIDDSTYFGKLLKLFLAMLCTTLAVMPVSMMYFSEISLISPFSNMLIIPLCSVCMILGMLYTVTFGLLPVLQSAGGIIKIIIFISEKISESEFCSISVKNGISAKIAVICMFGVMLVKVCLENRRITAFAVAFSVSSTFMASSFLRNAQRKIFTVAVLGSGTNAVSVVSYRGENYIFDLSGHYKSAEYAEKYVAENGIRAVDFISLEKNANALYSAYKEKFAFREVREWYTAHDISGFSGGNSVIFGTDGYLIENSRYKIRYADRTLDIVHGDSEMMISSAKGGISEKNALSVYYGNIPEKSDMICDGKSIYLDNKSNIFYQYSGMNNFIVEISDDGTFKIKNLK
ncbi:MAG: ComEC/Rec2 family competence protein [Ruminococcus sp.]|nr:ComEC/Rec2 family competence protein [Ruminococcus sp.]